VPAATPAGRLFKDCSGNGIRDFLEQRAFFAAEYQLDLIAARMQRRSCNQGIALDATTTKVREEKSQTLWMCDLLQRRFRVCDSFPAGWNELYIRMRQIFSRIFWRRVGRAPVPTLLHVHYCCELYIRCSIKAIAIQNSLALPSLVRPR